MAGFVGEATDFLGRAGYNRRDIVPNCTFTVKGSNGELASAEIDLVAFAHAPHDTRNACIVAFDAKRTDVGKALDSLRYLTAPLAIVGHQDRVEFWSVRKSPAPEPFDVCGRDDWAQRQQSRLADFSPATISDAKEDRIQLAFVDAGLETWTRSVTSTSLKALLEDLIASSIAQVKQPGVGHDAVLRLVFHLFACRALEDKGVIDRATSPEKSLQLAHERFSENISPEVLHSPHVTEKLARHVFDQLRDRFSFATLTTDILAHSYEHALVTEAGRREFGIFYTPQPITEYILRRLPIESIPQEDRVLWDPCCGCGSFLLAGFDRFSELLPDSFTPRERHAYLRKRLIGSDRDAFACELASLSLVLTDLHNHNGWNVRTLDATTATFKDIRAKPTIIATNLPFKEIKDGAGTRRELSADILMRLTEAAQPGTLFGIVLPQSFLATKATASARRKILETCDLLELAMFPGAFFDSATETAALLLRKRQPDKESRGITTVRELRSNDYQQFLKTESFTRTYPIEAWRWVGEGDATFRVSPLLDLWTRLEAECKHKLGDVASINNGLRVSTTGDQSSVSPVQTATHTKRYVDRLDVLRPFALLTENDLYQCKWLDYGDHLDRKRDPEIFTPQKVLINSNRNPGSAWRIVAGISRSALHYSENFQGVIPIASVTVEQLAAVLNSPVANGWFDAASKQRKIVAEILERLPFPEFDKRLGDELNDCVRRMEKAVAAKWQQEAEGMFYDGMEETADTTALLADIDSLVFDAYGLSPMERKHLANFMSTDKRPG